MVLGAVGIGYWLGQPTVLEAAYEACDYDDEFGAFLADEGHTLLLETAGDEDVLGMEYTDVLCAFTELEMPTRVITQIGATRALDGRVSDSWDGLTATWSYHPSSGLNLMITID